MVENGDRYKPVWITEMGWTIDPPRDQTDIRVSLEQQATYLVEALELIRREWPWVELITVWNLSRPTPGDPFGGYSLLDGGTASTGLRSLAAGSREPGRARQLPGRYITA